MCHSIPCLVSLLILAGCPRVLSGGPEQSLPERAGMRGSAKPVSPPRWLRFAAEHDSVRLRTIRATKEDVIAIRARLERRVRLRNVMFYEAVKNEQVVATAYYSVEGGLHGPIRYVAYLGPEGKVTRVKVTEHHEVRGAPVAGKRFLSQYVGKAARDPLRVGADVDAITGATISSKAMTRGVKKAVVLWEHYYKIEATTFTAKSAKSAK